MTLQKDIEDIEDRDHEHDIPNSYYGHFIDFHEHHGPMPSNRVANAGAFDTLVQSKIVCMHSWNDDTMPKEQRPKEKNAHRLKQGMKKMLYVTLVTALLTVSAMSLWDIF
jgi:hypothetical protein